MRELTKAQKRIEALSKLHQEVPNFAQRVAPIYRLLEWTWYDCRKAPKISKIEEVLHELVRNLELDTSSGETNTGGLEARCYFDGETKTYDAEIRFVVEATHK